MSASRLRWRLLSKSKKKTLLESMPILERRQHQKMMKRSMVLPGSFRHAGAVYVHVPKVAGKSLCDLFFNGENLGHMPYAWYEKIIPDLCDKYFTFSFVRNPWDRLVSAYHYLLSGGALKRDRELSKEISEFESFDEFVMCWLGEEKLKQHIHFVPQVEFLKNENGLIELDFIGRFENLGSDVERVCAHLNAGRVNSSDLKRVNSSPRGNYRNYYSVKSKEIVAELYGEDIALFGYSY